MSTLTVYGTELASRFLLGSAGYPSPQVLRKAIAARLISEVPGINRVVFDLTSKPPGTIEWE